MTKIATRRCCGFALLAALAFAPAAPAQTPACVIPPPLEEFQSVNAMPPPARDFLLSHFGDSAANIAARGAAFNATDVIRPDERLPARRVIDAGHRDERWFLWYKRGGVAHLQRLVLFKVAPGNGSVALVENATKGPRDDFCAQARSFLARGDNHGPNIENDW